MREVQETLPAAARGDGPALGDRTLTVEGTLERIVYSSDENAWSVVRVIVAGRREPLTAVGNLLGVQPGESLRLTGRLVNDRKWGEQLQVDSYVSVAPASLVGIERYLGSGLVRGIGRSLAKRLVTRFGLATLDVIEQEPARLLEVDGIGPVRSARIREAWTAQKEIKTVMVFLQSHGVSTAFATRIWKLYGAEAVNVVRTDPYRLATDIWGIGFKSADRIARNLGLPTDAPARIRAGLLYVLSQAGDRGHLFLPQSKLLADAAALLEVAPELVPPALADLEMSGDVVVEELPAAATPLGQLRERAIFLAALHAAEAGLAERLSGLLAAPASPLDVDVPRALAWFEQRAGIALAEGQRQAIAQALSAKLLVVTGGPGTGKTTLIKGVVEILGRKGRRLLLAAPTGRAAKRLSEATGAEAQTLHRLLAFDPQTRSFTRNQEKPLEADVVVVDEVSMLDVLLAYHLSKAVPATAQLVLVGDVDQLPSVGPGRVLADLIESGVVPVVRLGQVFRQAAASRIISNAHRINRGDLPFLDPPGPGELADFFFIERSEPADVRATIRELVGERIPNRFGLDPVEDVQVLTPMRRGELGATNLNVDLQQLLNPQGTPVGRFGQLRVGDKVMQVRNNYDLEVFNGDIGRVRAVDTDEDTVEVVFDGRSVIYEPVALDELVLAYACSIHKAQGSEYPCVVVPVHTQHFVMLQRNLIYTAVTRGRKLVVLVGTKKALAIAVGTADGERRNSRLAERLR
jgi:exodeoxyribonuclease V alpha subunit